MLRLVFLLPLLAACSAVSLSTTALLSRQNPLEVDPAGYRIIAYLPEGLDIAPGGAALELTARHGAATAEGRFALQRTGRADGGSDWAVAPADLPALRRLQAQARLWEERDPDATTGQMSIHLRPCNRGAGPAPSDRLHVNIVTQPGGPELPLLHPVSVARFDKTLQKAAGESRAPCPAAP